MPWSGARTASSSGKSRSSCSAARLAALAPLPTLLVWLGPVNIMLAIFNLVPGFPMDGGRVLRAILWAVTGNLRQATRHASRAGQGFAWLLLATALTLLRRGA